MNFVTHLPWTSRGRDAVCNLGPTHKVVTLFGCADDLHSRGILHVIHTKDCPVTWSVSLYSIGPGS